MLTKRLSQMKDAFDNLPQLEKLYYDCGEDIALLNNSLEMYLPTVRVAKEALKGTCKTISEFNREFDMTTTSDTLKSYKYQIEGLKHIKSSVRVRIDGLNTERII